ncbi:hypothetical protein F383_30852 [Gossypium arboreum]|uniref:Uncharacterized protein n=1 Tax=Gossypium arboreum TaxID=29729 RepID=A0A0B0MT03_GOSAR|nr:hypothetical protein F383_30852 [Gossypium arboreum]
MPCENKAYITWVTRSTTRPCV